MTRMISYKEKRPGRQTAKRLSVFLIACMMACPVPAFATDADPALPDAQLEQVPVVQEEVSEEAVQTADPVEPVIEDEMPQQDGTALPEENLDEQEALPDEQDVPSSGQEDLQNDQEDIQNDQEEQPGEQETLSDEQAQQKEQPEVRAAKPLLKSSDGTEPEEETVSRVYVTDCWVNLKGEVCEERLPGNAIPYKLRLSSSGSTIDLRWADCTKDGAAIDGYIVLRKQDVAKDYEEIARVTPEATSYADATAKVNTKYYYAVISYTEDDEQTISVSEKGYCLVGTRGDSKLKNAYSKTSGYTPYAYFENSSITLERTKTKKLSLVYPSDAVSTWTRWRTSDSSVVTVDQNGKLCGKKTGTATITAKTPAGWETCCKVKVVRSMSDVTVKGVKDLTYNGSARKQEGLALYYDGQKISTSNYTVSYKNNKNIGTATITITGKNDYAGQKKVTFRIKDNVSKTVTLSTGTKLVFKESVQQHTKLSEKQRPYWLRLTGLSSKKIYLKWTDCKSRGADLDGYIVLRRDGSTGSYKEIAKVSSKYCSYTDPNVKKDVKYFYVVVGYKKVSSSVYTVSEESLTAEGVRCDSKKKNPYAPNDKSLTPVVTRKASTVSLGRGKSKTLVAVYPSNSFSTWTRWRSNNPDIATVNSKGVVTGKKNGTAKVVARTPGGWDVYFTVKVADPTKVTDLATSSSLTSGFSHYDTVYVTPSYGRKLYLECWENGKWVTKKTFSLSSGTRTSKVKVTFTKDWWSKTSSSWRMRVPASKQGAEYISPTITIKTKRRYQNPSKMVQIQQTISKHGLSYYTSPVKIHMWSTRSNCVETMIDRAYDYLGDDYVVCQSREPGKGVDCSGIVMQACYAAGIDLWPSNPYRHQFPKYEYESRYLWTNSKLEKVSFSNRKRGDLIFYSKYGTIIHVAIYLGNDKIIHAWPGKIRVSSVYGWGDIAGVRRVFH